MKQTFDKVGCNVYSIKRIDKCLIGTGIIYSHDEDKYEYEVDVDAKTGQVIKFEKENMLTSNGDENINNESTTNQQSTTQQNSTQTNNTSANNNVNNNIRRNNNASTTNNGYIGESKDKKHHLTF